MTGRNRHRNSNEGTTIQIVKTALVLSAGVLVIMSATWNNDQDSVFRALDSVGVMQAVESRSAELVQSFYETAAGSSSTTPNPRIGSPFDIPEGAAEALPSIRVDEEVNRGIYGGKGDKKHLGGFTTYDGDGVSTTLWKHMLSNYGIKSIIDIGCGKGVSTLWFDTHGADVLCVEGSHDAVQRSLLPHPESQVIEHDFSRGPYWPAETYDAVWSVEFLEHVGRNFQYNYVQTMRKSALIFASHSQWGGWHHVEVHDDEWWINKFESFGFKYSQKLTEEARQIARDERNKKQVIGPDGKPANAQHIWLNMQVFINPAVASLPKHAHLFSEPGCYLDRIDGKIVNRECGTGKGVDTESKLPASYYPLALTSEQDEAWLQKVKQSIESAPVQQ